MTANELFAHCPPEKSAEILEYLRNEDRASYRAVLNLLATRRKLRPVFLEKKSRADQIRWIAEMLGKKANEDLALEILQSWLLKSRQAMILEFLASLGIEHDGAGIIEGSPSEPAEATVLSAVEKLRASHDREDVLLYLHLFVQMDPDGWPVLRKILSAPVQEPAVATNPETV